MTLMEGTPAAKARSRLPSYFSSTNANDVVPIASAQPTTEMMPGARKSEKRPLSDP